jgi:oxygen-independent coproporphyrinogen III oxidase
MGEIDRVLGLLERYDRPGPRYTSYPTAVEFEPSYDEAQYRSRLGWADEAASEPLSLYVHVPFCAERCSYCGCNVVITQHREVAEEYLTHLHREVDLLAAALPHRRRVSQYHWGGGTPTYLSVEQIRELHRCIARAFEIEADAESAIEIDPRVTSAEQMEVLRECGFNRVSMGVQDLDPQVQAAIHRNQTEDETCRLFDVSRELGFASINIDLIYGLPRQTVERFERTMEHVVALAPDRLAIYSYAHMPWLKAHQKRIDEAALPAPRDKLRLFCIARDRLLAAGYVAIGMDHFARPDDELAHAAANRRLHRNFMGYTVRMGRDMVGLGITAIGEVRGSFAQNARKMKPYYDSIDRGVLPVERGYVLSEDDRIRREVILRLMCNFHVGMAEIERAFGISFTEYFADELAELRAPEGAVEHGFVEIGPDAVEVVGDGRLFVRNVAMVFDRHSRAHAGPRAFSRTV